jgi:hypothetical protein
MKADRKEQYRCALCGHLLFVGHLAPGSLIEVKCHNRKCQSNVTKTMVTVAAAS